MGDKIEFPHNDRMYFEQAVNHVASNQFEEALNCMETVYASQQNPTTNHLYAFILYTLERYEEALEIADEQKAFYVENEKNSLLYTMMLIKNQLYLEAEVLIQEGLSTVDPLVLAEWKNLERELNSARERSRIEMEAHKKKIKSELSEIASYSPIKQSEMIEEARVLELEDLQEIAPMIFSNPMVSPLTKRAYLEDLVEKQDPNEYNFLWFDQQRKVIPIEIDWFDQTPTVNELDDILEQKLHKHPSLLEVVRVEIVNDLLLLYPFIEEIVTDLDYWVDCYVSALDFSEQLEVDSQPKTGEQEKLNEWVQKFHQMAHRAHLSE